MQIIIGLEGKVSKTIPITYPYLRTVKQQFSQMERQLEELADTAKHMFPGLSRISAFPTFDVFEDGKIILSRPVEDAPRYGRDIKLIAKEWLDESAGVVAKNTESMKTDQAYADKYVEVVLFQKLQIEYMRMANQRFHDIALKILHDHMPDIVAE